MKRIAISVLLLFSHLAFAETPEKLFDEANLAYQQARYPSAIERYEELLSSGYNDGEIFYNLGNAYYKAGNIGKAILNYERAQKLVPNDDDLTHNLKLVNLMINDRIEPTPRLFVWDWWDEVKAAFSLNGITWLSYLLYILLVVSISLMTIASSYTLRRLGLLSGFVTALGLIVALVIFTGKLKAVGDTSSAIVTVDITTIKNSPDPKSSDAFVLHTGVKVQITDKVNEWVKIRLADGKVGWMEEGAAEII